MKKRGSKGLALASLLTIGTINALHASMADQLIYNVLGQVTNAAGARLGDEIYYGSSRRSAPPKHRRSHRKKKPAAPKYVMTDEMRIQQALKSLGFYRGPIDGEINSFETRHAIKEFNVAYGIGTTAILTPQVRDSLIYLGTLFEFDRNLIARGTDKYTKGKKIQTALKIHGFYHSKIDGIVGSGTRRAVAEYKTANGMYGSGSLDYEEEYRLISSAKEINDKNIEETLAALKAMGRPAPRSAVAPAGYGNVAPANAMSPAQQRGYYRGSVTPQSAPAYNRQSVAPVQGSQPAVVSPVSVSASQSAPAPASQQGVGATPTGRESVSQSSAAMTHPQTSPAQQSMGVSEKIKPAKSANTSQGDSVSLESLKMYTK